MGMLAWVGESQTGGEVLAKWPGAAPLWSGAIGIGFDAPAALAGGTI
jgi:hypothetical protein